MSLKKMKKEELEQLTNKEITKLIIQDAKKPQTIASLFKKIHSELIKQLVKLQFKNVLKYLPKFSPKK